jgi:hypothetical protein
MPVVVMRIARGLEIKPLSTLLDRAVHASRRIARTGTAKSLPFKGLPCCPQVARELPKERGTQTSAT